MVDDTPGSGVSTGSTASLAAALPTLIVATHNRAGAEQCCSAFLFAHAPVETFAARHCTATEPEKRS